MFSDADRKIDTQAVHVGLVGNGIQKSRTPAMHEAEGAAQGLRYVYRLHDTAMMEPEVPPLGDIIKTAEACGYAGLNITYPYKVEVIDHLDELSEAATAVGAVNTVVFHDGRRSGHNTDLWGFAENFRRNMAGVARENALLIGAGGAGAAVAHALVGCGAAKILIADTNKAKAEALAEAVRAKHGAERAEAVNDLAEAAARADGLVNASPVGMAQLPGMPIDAAMLRADMWVADIVYIPLETELLRIARTHGCRTLSGAGMAVFQAVRAFELFTGLAPDVARMEAAFNDYQGEESR